MTKEIKRAYVYRPKGTNLYAIGMDDEYGNTMEIFGRYADLDFLESCARDYLDGDDLAAVLAALEKFRAS